MLDKLKIVFLALLILYLQFFIVSSNEKESVQQLLEKWFLGSQTFVSEPTQLLHETVPPSEAEPANESCSELFQIVGQHFKINQFVSYYKENSALVSYDCRQFYDYPGYIIGVFAYKTISYNHSQLLITLIDAKSNLVISSYQRPIFEDDKFRLSQFSLSIDRERIPFERGLNAFRINISNGEQTRKLAECANYGRDHYLSLFAIEGKTIRPLLQRFAMKRWQYKNSSSRCNKGAKFARNSEYLMTEMALRPMSLKKIEHSTSMAKHHQSEIVYPNLIVKAVEKKEKITREQSSLISEEMSFYELRYEVNQYSKVLKHHKVPKEITTNYFFYTLKEID